MSEPIEDIVRRSCILVVDDDETNARGLERLLRRDGYDRVHAVTDPRRALGTYDEIAPDLLVLDLHMPYLDGFDLLAGVAGREHPQGRPPILVLTGDPEPDTRRRALAAGARDFVSKPFEPVELLLRVRNLLETRHLHLSLRRHAAGLEDEVAVRTRELEDTRLEVLRRLAVAAEYRDDVTGRHAERVGIMSARLARRLDLSQETVDTLRRAGPLHDVGKIGIPDRILLKPGPLTPAEFEVMKRHVRIGARILGGSDYPLLRMAREIALTHHERWDGSGYIGLRGPRTPLVGRVVAVADAFDSLTHERPYKRPIPVEDAVERIGADAGSHFDPGVVEAFDALVGDGGIDAEVLEPVPLAPRRVSSRGRSARGPRPASPRRARPWSRRGDG